MSGMCAQNGKPLADIEHLRQSVVDILSTRIGTRVMRRDYGSNVKNLIDAPINQTFAVDIYIAVAEALSKWEPRLKLSKIAFTKALKRPKGVSAALKATKAKQEQTPTTTHTQDKGQSTSPSSANKPTKIQKKQSLKRSLIAQPKMGKITRAIKQPNLRPISQSLQLSPKSQLIRPPMKLSKPQRIRVMKQLIPQNMLKA